jgi:hypothetical protein
VLTLLEIDVSQQALKVSLHGKAFRIAFQGFDNGGGIFISEQVRDSLDGNFQ